MNPAKEAVFKKADIIKCMLSKHLDIEKSAIAISEPVNKTDGFGVDIEVKFKIPQKSLKTFRLVTYTFSICIISDKGFLYEGQCYSFDEMRSFLQKISNEIG